ncbi:MAG: hypothetical protein C5B49_09920 [Bdellovibrio sp.]|nr:MAG: hypothetical protein C5B49_09920 [Bdellovibrio sp.]
MKRSEFFVFLSLTMFCLNLRAKPPVRDEAIEGPTEIQMKTWVRINSYDEETRTFDLTATAEEAIGPLIADRDIFLKAIDQPNNKNPKGLVGSEKPLSMKIPLLSDKEVKKRQSEKKKRR